MKKINVVLTIFISLMILVLGCGNPSGNGENNDSNNTGKDQIAKKKFTVAWSIYAGWMPWDYAGQSGILKKWADKYNLEIELVKMDYIASIEAYVAGQADACVMTNMEALDMPAASGVTSTALIIGDYSNGNDAILTRDGMDVSGLKGQDVYLVELSVSHYMLSRALEMNGLSEEDVKVVNTSDSDIAPAFLANKDQKAVVTWNPLVMQIQQEEGVSNVFSSADIPEEVLDMMVVNSKTLADNPDLGKALTGAWYEIMGVMNTTGDQTNEAMKIMAESAGCTIDEYKSQLETTAMFYNAQEAVDYVSGKAISNKMDYVRTFCFEHGLLGENAKSADEIGISYPDGTVQGDKNNVQLIFDASFMKMSAEGKL